MSEWKLVGPIGVGVSIPPGSSKLMNGSWWHHQGETGRLFRYDAGFGMPPAGVGAGDGSCPAGCDYHEIDGEGACYDGEMNPCGSAPRSKGFNDVEPDCGWAGRATRNAQGQWVCPQTPGCNPGQVRDVISGQCVSAGTKRGQCASNESYNPTTGKCEVYVDPDNDCAANELKDAVTGKCAPMCADFTRRRNGLCPNIPGPGPLPAPKVDPPPPRPDPNPKPPALSAKGVMPWLIGLSVLAGVGFLAYEATKKKPGQPAKRLGRMGRMRRRRLSK